MLPEKGGIHICSMNLCGKNVLYLNMMKSYFKNVISKSCRSSHGQNEILAVDLEQVKRHLLPHSSLKNLLAIV